MNIDSLKSALSDPALAGLTDDQVVTRPGFVAPVLTPKAGIVVTYVTLASVWGAARLAQFKAQIKGAIAQTDNPQFAALADSIDTVLRIGVDPANRDVPGVGAQFVAGEAVTAADVHAARLSIDWDRQADDLRGWLNNAAGQANALIGAGQQNGQLPSKQQLQATFDPNL